VNTHLQGRPIKILLVDDDLDDTRLTLETLEDSKLYTKVSTAREGIEALAFLRQEGKYADALRPDLVLLDLHMPRKSGFEVLAEMKADPVLKHIPVVILTTSLDEEKVQQSYDLGASCFVTKPVDLDQFVTIVHSI